jgi:hypothetical protein
MSSDKGFIPVLIKAVLFLLLISSVSVAQDNKVPASADVEASAPTEVSLADTLDFIKRKLMQERTIPGARQNADGSVDDEDLPSTTYKLLILNARNGRVEITELSNEPYGYRSAPGGGGPGTIYSFKQTTAKREFSLATLEPTAVSVERGQQDGSRLNCYQSYRVVLQAKDGQKVISNETDSIFTHTPPIPDQAEERASGKSNTISFWFEDKQLATRVAKAFVHAIILASPEAKPDVF